MQGWINFGAGHSKESYNVKKVTKVKSLRIALTNVWVALIVTRLVEQFRFARRPHSSYDFSHDIDSVASGFKLDPNETQKATQLNQSMSQRPHPEMHLGCLPQHAAVAYLFFVKC
jgi:hypothetical protein